MCEIGFFTPDVIAEICAELGLPYRTNGYRYWTKGILMEFCR